MRFGLLALLLALSGVAHAHPAKDDYIESYLDKHLSGGNEIVLLKQLPALISRAKQQWEAVDEKYRSAVSADARAASLAGGASESPGSFDVFWRLALCESGGNRHAYNPAGPYYSYFQWSMTTWLSVGGHGDPRNASYQMQLRLAQILQARSGWGQWPSCSAKLGLPQASQ